jgi:hypothetical protein
MAWHDAAHMCGTPEHCDPLPRHLVQLLPHCADSTTYSLHATCVNRHGLHACLLHFVPHLHELCIHAAVEAHQGCGHVCRREHAALGHSLHLITLPAEGGRWGWGVPGRHVCSNGIKCIKQYMGIVSAG